MNEGKAFELTAMTLNLFKKKILNQSIEKKVKKDE